MASNQDIVDMVDSAISVRVVTPEIKEKILNAVYNVLSDHREDE